MYAVCLTVAGALALLQLTDEVDVGLNAILCVALLPVILDALNNYLGGR